MRSFKIPETRIGRCDRRDRRASRRAAAYHRLDFNHKFIQISRLEMALDHFAGAHRWHTIFRHQSGQSLFLHDDLILR